MSDLIHCIQLEEDDSAWANPNGNCGGATTCQVCRARLVRFSNLVAYEMKKRGLRMPQTDKEWRKIMNRPCNRRGRREAARARRKAANAKQGGEK